MSEGETVPETMGVEEDTDISTHGRPRGQDNPSTWMSVDKVRSMKVP